MKKFLFLLLGVVAFAACKDDDDGLDDGLDDALLPGSKFQMEIEVDSRKNDVDATNWVKRPLDVEFTVVEGERDETPLVCVSKIKPINFAFKLTLPYCLVYDSHCSPEYYRVVGLADNCIYDKDNSILSVAILHSYIEYIGDKVFKGAERLEELSLGFVLRKIGREAFRGCSMLPRLEWNNPEAEISIGKYAFAECTALERVEINVKEANIGEGVFKGCSSLNRVTINGEKLDFGRDAFKGCTNLETVTLSAFGETIEDGMFCDMPNLFDVKIGAGAKLVKNGAFKNCARLKYVHLPGTLDRIEAGAFQNCPSLEIIYITGGDHLVEIVENRNRENE